MYSNEQLASLKKQSESDDCKNFFKLLENNQEVIMNVINSFVDRGLIKKQERNQ